MTVSSTDSCWVRPALPIGPAPRPAGPAPSGPALQPAFRSVFHPGLQLRAVIPEHLTVFSLPTGRQLSLPHGWRVPTDLYASFSIKVKIFHEKSSAPRAGSGRRDACRSGARLSRAGRRVWLRERSSSPRRTRPSPSRSYLELPGSIQVPNVVMEQNWERGSGARVPYSKPLSGVSGPAAGQASGAGHSRRRVPRQNGGLPHRDGTRGWAPLYLMPKVRSACVLPGFVSCSINLIDCPHVRAS